MKSVLGLGAGRAVLVLTATRRGGLEPGRLRPGGLRQLDGGKGHDRHRADSDPGNGDVGDASPGQAASRTAGSNRAYDRVHIAQPGNCLANRRLLGNAGLPEVSHAVLEVVLELAQDAAAL
jgi:hypothetical protein